MPIEVILRVSLISMAMLYTIRGIIDTFAVRAFGGVIPRLDPITGWNSLELGMVLFSGYSERCLRGAGCKGSKILSFLSLENSCFLFG